MHDFHLNGGFRKRKCVLFEINVRFLAERMHDFWVKWGIFQGKICDFRVKWGTFQGKRRDFHVKWGIFREKMCDLGDKGVFLKR